MFMVILVGFEILHSRLKFLAAIFFQSNKDDVIRDSDHECMIERVENITAYMSTCNNPLEITSD